MNLIKTQNCIIDFKSVFFLFHPFSASGTSAVAIDNKIEQAMVSSKPTQEHFSVDGFPHVSPPYGEILQDSNQRENI